MRIESLIKKLNKLKGEYGNVRVSVSSNHIDARGFDGGFLAQGFLIQSTSKRVVGVVICSSEKKLPSSKPKTPPVKSKESLESLSNLLTLVGIFMTAEELKKFHAPNLKKIGTWAAKTHIAASDNYVRVPRRPRCLPEPWSKEAGYQEGMHGIV